jgi:hypothetical protein
MLLPKELQRTTPSPRSLYRLVQWTSLIFETDRFLTSGAIRHEPLKIDRYQEFHHHNCQNRKYTIANKASKFAET